MVPGEAGGAFTFATKAAAVRSGIRANGRSSHHPALTARWTRLIVARLDLQFSTTRAL